MAKVNWRHPGLNIFAIYDEAGTLGEKDDPNAPRNAPFIDPQNNLDKIYLHTDLDIMEVSHGPITTTINHESVPSASGPSGQVGVNGVMFYGTTYVDTVLVTHNLGYVPDFFVIESGDIVYPGRPVQVIEADGRQRRVAAYANLTQIILREWYVRTSEVLPAVTCTYTAVVFRRPPGPSGNILFYRDPITGVIEAAKGKFKSDRRYLQVTPIGSSYGFSLGRTIDLNNGAPRYVDPDGSISDTVPATIQLKLIMTAEPTTGPFGDPLTYNGSYTGAPSVLVQVP